MSNLARSGTVMVYAAGNDRYYAAYDAAFNKSDHRSRLFRGIHAGGGKNLTPSAAALNRRYSDEQWREIEKHHITAVMLNANGEISSYSNICGISKYYCIGMAGGFLDEPQNSKEVETPSIPAGMMLQGYVPDASGKKCTYFPITGPTMPSGQYKILSTVVGTSALAGSDKDEVMANLIPKYGMSNGTSMAAPMLTAALGVTKSRFPYLKNWQVRDVVLTTGDESGAPGIDRVYGWGSVNLETAMGGPKKLFALRNDVTFSTLGVRLSLEQELSRARPIRLDATLGWQHKPAGRVPRTMLSCVAGGEAFAARSAPLARDAAVIRVSAGVALSKQGSVSLGYAGVMGGRYAEHAVTGNAVWRF